MKKMLSSLALLLLVFNAGAQLLQPFMSSSGNIRSEDKNITAYKSLTYDANAFSKSAELIPRLDQLQNINSSNAILELPLADGTWARFFVAEVLTISKEMAALYPMI